MVDVVCLCEMFPFKEYLGPAFAEHSDIRLVNPDDVDDPNTITKAIAFRPAPNDFDRFPNLEVLCCPGAGVDGLLLHPKLPTDLPVIRLINKEQAKMMAGFAAWHVVGHHREMDVFAQYQQRSEWAPRLGNKVPSTFPVTVLGYGEIGAAIGHTMVSMGYPVTGWASRARVVDGVEVLSGAQGLETVLRRAKAVINVLPLTDQTRNILNRETFALMREDAILVQLGRGEHLVEEDLIEALDAGRPASAALDVFVQEPLPKDSPLWTHPKVTVSPHIASDAGPADIAKAIAQSFAEFSAGITPAGLVDRSRGY